MDDLGAKLEQERQWAVGILRTMADKLESLSLEELAEPLTLVMGPVEKLDEWMQKLWKAVTGRRPPARGDSLGDPIWRMTRRVSAYSPTAEFRN